MGSHVAADHRYGGAVIVVAAGDVPSRRRFLNVHFADIRSNSPDADVIQGIAALTHAAAGSDFHADVFGELHIVAQVLVVIPLHFAVPANGASKRLGIGNEPVLADQEDVGSHVGNALGNVAVNARNERNDNDQGRNRENDPQQHQKRSQFMRANVFQGDGGGFAQR